MTRNFVLCFFCLIMAMASAQQEQLHRSNKFYAKGVTEPVVDYLKPGWPVPRELKNVAVEVHFDRLPTKMRFSMPCYPSMITENNIHFSNGWTETYDPKASSSCEILWDREARYARMWVVSQNPARMIVRFRAAISDPDGYIAHSDIPSKSPYGKGDWTDEWYYIYPDGTHTRHVRIYTGLASQSLLVTDETFQDEVPVREIPPTVVHEFQEDFVFGLDGHLPMDDISSTPLTFLNAKGQSHTISYLPYPPDYGRALKSNIKVINLKARFRPFTISMPYGLENEPYPPEGDLPYVFQTWGGGDGEGYSTSLGHSLNWWHFKRTDHLLEQVYLSGFHDSTSTVNALLDWERSWLIFPRLMMAGLGDPYLQPTYSQEQRAYIIPGDHQGARKLEFTLGFAGEDEGSLPTISIINPVFVVKNWGEQGVKIKVGGKRLKEDKDFRIGNEETPSGTDLVIWMDLKSAQGLSFSLEPKK